MSTTTTFTRNLPKKAPTNSVPGHRVKRGTPLPLGASLHRQGINFSIFSRYATACTLVLFEPGAKDPFVELALDPRANRTGEVWHVFVEALDAGIQYGYRFDMQPNPDSKVHR